MPRTHSSSCSSFVLLFFLSATAWAQAPAPWVPEIGERHFIAVIVADIDQSATWYVQTFGLAEHDRWTADDSTARIINLTSERLFVELIWRAEAPDVERDLGFYKFGFWVPDVDAVADRVEAATGERPRALDFQDHNLRLIQIRDLDGNIIQLSETLAGQGEAAPVDLPAFNEWEPAWSPDGQQVAFYTDASGTFEVWVVNADGTGRRKLTDGGNPRWSPDGSRIAFAHLTDDGNIYTIRPDGSGLTQLTNSPNREFEAHWSPDGQHISYVEKVDGMNQLRIVRSDGSDIQSLSHPGVPSAQHPAWSPDGKTIAFFGYTPEYLEDRAGDLFTLDLETGTVTRLTDSAANDRYPDWSPDGSRIAFASNLGGAFDIYTIRPDGSGLTNVTRSEGDDYHPAWSPDGEHIAVDWELAPEDHQALYLVALPDARRRRLVP